ncbi:MAG: hypothetical protein AAFR74_05800, partial [Pseudomonadota bacterium]
MDLFERTKAVDFLPKDHSGGVIDALVALPADISVTPPRFRSTVRKAQDLLKNEEKPAEHELGPLNALQLTPDAVPAPAETFRLDVLTQVYQSGFRAWLSDKLDDPATCRRAFDRVVGDKTRRRTEFDLERKRFYKTPIKFLEEFGLSQFDTLQGLFKALQSMLMTERTSDRPYINDERAQQAATSLLNTFKQELFAHLFVAYLDDAGLTWLTRDLTEIKDHQRLSISELEGLVPEETAIVFAQPWHAQIYTWFYLIPSADVAKLQHQMRKSRALEAKTHIAPDDAVQQKLSNLDELMSLYIQVQETGFDGTEHEDVLDDTSFLYCDPDDYTALYDVRFEEHKTTLAGSRRGLRQLARFAHLPVLKGVFSKHAITKQEVLDFKALHAKDDTDAG